MTDVLAALTARFLQRCAADLDQLDRRLNDAPFESADLDALFHRLAGAAGTFGFAAIGAAAGACDDAFARGEAPDRAAVERLAETIREALPRASN